MAFTGKPLAALKIKYGIGGVEGHAVSVDATSGLASPDEHTYTG